MFNYDIHMSGERIKKTNVLSSNKWQVPNTIPLLHIIILSNNAHPWKMAQEKVNTLPTNKEVYQSQNACVSYLNTKQRMHSMRKLMNICSNNFMLERHNKQTKTLKPDNYHVIDLIVFYKNRRSLIVGRSE